MNQVKIRVCQDKNSYTGHDYGPDDGRSLRRLPTESQYAGGLVFAGSAEKPRASWKPLIIGTIILVIIGFVLFVLLPLVIDLQRVAP